MNYDIKITKGEDVAIPGTSVVLPFGRNDFRIEWNKQTQRHDIKDGVTFYGGFGEGSSFAVWDRAIHTSLYDAYQMFDELKDGDTFTVTYEGKTAKFIATGVHVVKG